MMAFYKPGRILNPGQYNAVETRHRKVERGTGKLYSTSHAKIPHRKEGWSKRFFDSYLKQQLVVQYKCCRYLWRFSRPLLHEIAVYVFDYVHGHSCLSFGLVPKIL